jgi:hypothetical protein
MCLGMWTLPASAAYQPGMKPSVSPGYVLLPNGPSTAQNRWRWFVPLPHFCIHECAADFRQKAQLLSLLRQTDFADQFGVARIGTQGIEREVRPEGDQPVVFLVCGVEPLEGMVLVA